MRYPPSVALLPKDISGSPETEPGDVVDLCERIEKAVCAFKLSVGDGKTASVGVSLGASGYPQEGETFDQMIVAADKIMYERKVSRKRFALTHNVDQVNRAALDRIPAPNEFGGHGSPSSDSLIVELDESHVLSSSSAIN